MFSRVMIFCLLFPSGQADLPAVDSTVFRTLYKDDRGIIINRI